MVQRTVWVHEPDGETIEVPEGLGGHLRPLGWRPAGGGASVPVAEEPEKPAPRRTGRRKTVN